LRAAALLKVAKVDQPGGVQLDRGHPFDEIAAFFAVKVALFAAKPYRQNGGNGLGLDGLKRAWQGHGKRSINAGKAILKSLETHRGLPRWRWPVISGVIDQREEIKTHRYVLFKP
jgi:hypothetical protein